MCGPAAQGGAAWRSRREHTLRATPYADIAGGPFADDVFACDWDAMSKTLRIREAGCHEGVRSPQMFLRPFARFRELEVLP